MEKYWMVHVSGEKGGNYKHPSLECAKAEAERLSRENPGKTVTVLESVGAVMMEAPIPPPCVWLKITEDMPF